LAGAYRRRLCFQPAITDPLGEFRNELCQCRRFFRTVPPGKINRLHVKEL
jgi:hypothetical protein